jgi:predicted kinase
MDARLTVVCGNAGTGKTTWARALARHQRAALLDIDSVSERLVVAAQRELGRDTNDRDSRDYKRVFRDAIHETLFAVARDCAGPIVLVAPFTKERVRPDFPDFLQAHCEERPEIHYFVTNESVREARLRARQNPRDAAKLVDYAAYRDSVPIEMRPPYPHRWFDTTDAFPSID